MDRTITVGQTSGPTITIWGNDDTLDEPDEVVTGTLSADPNNALPAGVTISTTANTATVTIRDDDPTVVSLARVGTGAVDEGVAIEFTVTLGRALIAGETIDVPLSIGGSGVTPADWRLAEKSGVSLNTGVSLSGTSTATPVVRFSGAGAQTATLELTPAIDNVAEGTGSETFAIALGPDGTGAGGFDHEDRATNVGGGADPHATASMHSFSVQVDDVTVATPILSIALPSGEGVRKNAAGQQELAEVAGSDPLATPLNFNVSLSPAPSADFTACVRVSESGGARMASGDKGVKTVTVPSSGADSVMYGFTDTSTDDRNSVVTVAAVAPETPGCSATNGSYTVSATEGAAAALITDDDPTVVALTRADATMREGDASDTATVTVGLARRLYAGEVIAVPLTLATTTGARLPGDATPDFTVSASGTGVTAADTATARPKLTFTGHDTDTVQTATVTFTPVSGRDDGDTDHEAVTATLASDSVLRSTAGTGTTAGGGAVRHATDFAADLTLTDDEAPATELTLTLSSASAPEGSGATRDVAVTVAKPAGSVAMAYRLCFSGTATLDENGTQAAGEDYRLIHFDGSTVHTAFGSGGLAGCVGNGTVTFAAGTDRHTWRVRVFGDTAQEPDETVVVTLSESANPLPAGWSVSTAGNPATHTITNDDASPHVTLHTVDPVAVEGSTTNTAGIEVRLSGALDTGRTLAVTVQTHTDIWDVSLAGAPAGVAYSGSNTQHQLVFTGPGAPTRARLKLAARANTVHGDGLQSRHHYVELTSATGYTGATVDTGKASRQFLQVIDRASTAGHGVTLQVSSEPLWRDGSRRRPEEGDAAVLIVSSTGGKPVSVTVAVQPVTADFADLGRASEGGYLSADNHYPENATGWVAYKGRDAAQGLDLYAVSIFRC